MATNNDYPWWARLLTESIKSFGITTVIVVVLLYALVKVIIPEMVTIANRYCNAVETTQSVISDTQKRLATNQEQLVDTQQELVRVVDDVAVAAREIVIVEKESQEFMHTVQDQHDEHLKKLMIIEAAVVPQPADANPSRVT